MEKVFIGTELKFKLEIEAKGFDMTSGNFKVDLVCGKNVITKTKDSIATDGEGNYYVCFDTADLGVGKVTAIVTAYVPDADFPDGLRTSVQKLDIGVIRE